MLISSRFAEIRRILIGLLQNLDGTNCHTIRLFLSFIKYRSCLQFFTPTAQEVELERNGLLLVMEFGLGEMA
ncbi:MAG: hypothetical protein ACP5LD_01575 [Desulfomonilaceae bacterium]